MKRCLRSRTPRLDLGGRLVAAVCTYCDPLKSIAKGANLSF